MSSARDIGLGCMRLSTDLDRDEARSISTLHAALDAGVTLLDTAAAYGLGEHDMHHNEALIARALASWPQPTARRPRVVTKIGLARRGASWIPEGSARAITRAAEESVRALGAAPDALLLHVPDPKVPLATSIRALAELERAGMARSVGVSNVSLTQLDEARSVHPGLAWAELALGAFDDEAARGGVLSACLASDAITVLAHTPLGGPKKLARLGRDPTLAPHAERLGVTVPTLVLAWLYALSPRLVPIPGARRPETAVLAARAARVVLDDEAQGALDRRFAPISRAARGTGAPATLRDDAEIVLVMGLPAAGKTSAVREWTERGYERLNRDERGGTLSGLAKVLDERLAAGVTRFVADNTYVSRASRADVLEIARAHGVPVCCVWLDTPLEQAQINAVARLLAKHGRLLERDELKREAKRDPNTFAPNAQFGMRRTMEPPRLDEGFTQLERRTFTRAREPGHERSGVVILDQAIERVLADPALRERAERADALLVFAWSTAPETLATRAAALAEALHRALDTALCPHPAGPPICWCRPPLPGLLVPWLARERIDPARSLLVGTGPAHRALAAALGLAYAES